jgi:hypothetical protein
VAPEVALADLNSFITASIDSCPLKFRASRLPIYCISLAKLSLSLCLGQPMSSISMAPPSCTSNPHFTTIYSMYHSCCLLISLDCTIVVACAGIATMLRETRRASRRSTRCRHPTQCASRGLAWFAVLAVFLIRADRCLR